MLWSIFIVLCIASYLCGSLSFAVLISRLLKLPDPRAHGSNNPGATNVLRLGGKQAAVLVLLADVLKGFIPVLVSAYILSYIQVPFDKKILLSVIALAAFLGHLYPAFFYFKGGKGVATGIGVIFGLSLSMGLAVIFTWCIIAMMFRYSSLAALVAMGLLPVYSALWWDGASVPIMMIISAMLFWRHRANITRLWQGSEPKMGKKN